MTNPHPSLTSLAVPQDPNAGWQPRPVNTDVSAATGSDPSGYTRAIMQDGKVVHAETGKASIGSTASITAQDMPFDYAVHPVTKCRVSSHELQEDSIVFFGEASMTIAQARAADFLPAGWTRPGSQPNPTQPQPTREAPNRPFDEAADGANEEPNPDLQGEAFSNAVVEQGLTTIVNNTSGMEQMSAIEEIINNGEVGERTLATLATQMALEPEQLQQQFAPVMQAFEQQARTVMSEGGLDSNDVVAWAQRHQPDMLNRAMHKQATLRSTSGYATLRQEYLESMAEHSPSVALNADLGQGVTQRQDAKGRVIVMFPDGSEVEWRHAIRAFGRKG